MKKLILIVGIAAGTAAFMRFWPEGANWDRLAQPGSLSASHAFLEDNCAACHTAVSGVEAVKCILCHSNNQNLLQRMPTAFHAHIDTCTECHLEHQGSGRRPTLMSHSALADIGLARLRGDEADSENKLIGEQLAEWIRRSKASFGAGSGPQGIEASEAVLDCATCHASDDRHFQLFGGDCVACHGTEKWTIPEFRHPSSRSIDCAQCHQAPPSHYMQHFQMISMPVARVKRAEVSQCYLCHQTTSWPDILGVGWYKHH